jgi:molybdate transport system ATP-binding protein
MAVTATEFGDREVSIDFRLQHHFGSLGLDVAFVLPTPGITVIFGPSGAGKSTLLAATAGLFRPTMCRIEIDGRVVGDTAAGIWLAPEKRRVGLVFQDARLFPHMTVESNLRYGLRRAPPSSIAFQDIVELLDISHLLLRRPHNLSGGERQRVAVGRALLAQPLLLLLDEPVANIDDARKQEILPYLVRLGVTLSLPMIYVTHSVDELTRVADSVVLLESGRVVAAGPLDQIGTRGDLPLAQREDAAAVFTARIGEHDAGRQLTRLDAAEAPIWVPLLAGPSGSIVRVRLPAREVMLATREPEAISVHNRIPGTVRAITAETQRHASLVEIISGERALLARVTPDAVARLELRPGASVIAMFKSMSVQILS